MTISTMCNRVTVTIQRQATAEDAARLMRSQHVGDVVVVDPADTRRPVGIITDRDIAINIVAQGLAPSLTPVGSVMSAYMDLNDVPATGNRWLMQDDLRADEGHVGFVA